uniref:Apple domain-containing protein n=1 Tax=Ditylenchus dipsaci TaxID=166011 RepID=A0A915EJB3_9BILA
MRHPTTQLYMQNIPSTSSYQPSLTTQRILQANCQSFLEQSRRKTLLPYHLLALLLLLIGLLPTKTLAEASARCYFFGPGTTIAGSDYRRDYGIERKACAETCKFDACCLAFEWSKTDGICTLKSRSLNGTVEPAADDTYFGLCLDYDDAERIASGIMNFKGLQLPQWHRSVETNAVLCVQLQCLLL